MFNGFIRKNVPGVCTDLNTPDWSSVTAAILTYLTVSFVILVSAGTVAWKVKGAYRPALALLLCYFFGVIWVLSGNCLSWATTVNYILLLTTVTIFFVYWSRPAFLRPGGALSWLMYNRVKVATKGTFGKDTILLGKADDYDWTYGQWLLVIVYLTWIYVAVQERFSYYNDEIGFSATYAFGKAVAHASLRFHFFCEASGHRFVLVWALVGIPYERSVAFHKITGRMMYLCVLIHFICIIATWDEHKDVPGHSFSDSLDLSRSNILFGLLAFIFLNLLVITSIPWVRRMKFEDFYWNHVNFKFMMQVMMVLHHRAYAMPFAVVLVLSFYLDAAFRYVSKVVCKVTLTDARIVCDDTSTNTTFVRLEMERDVWPGGFFSHHAGDYIMLSLGTKDSKAMPIGKYLSSMKAAGAPPLPAPFLFHPYTISSPPNYKGGKKIVVMLKSMGPGTWSDEVCNMFKPGVEGVDVSLVNPHIGGPMGRLGIEPTDYETVVLCAGGIGVTTMCAIWSDIAQKSANDNGKIKKVVVAWAAPCADSFAAFNEFLEVVDNSKNGIQFDMRGFVTRVSSDSGENGSSINKCLDLKYGTRPNFQSIISEAIGDMSQDGYAGVFACGPGALMWDVTHAVDVVNGMARGAVIEDASAVTHVRKGRVHLHKETFEW